MAISVVQTAQNSAGGSGVPSPSATVTLGSSTTGGNLLVVAISTGANTTNAVVSGITLGGSAGNFGRLATFGTTSAEATLDFWADPGCTGGQTAVAVTTSGGVGANGFITASVLEISGLDSVILDKSSSQDVEIAAASWSSLTTATTSQASELWVGLTGTFAAGTGGATITGPSSPWTNLAQQAPGSESMCGYQVVSSTGTATYSGTFSPSEHYVAAVITLMLPAPGSGLLAATFP